MADEQRKEGGEGQAASGSSWGRLFARSRQRRSEQRKRGGAAAPGKGGQVGAPPGGFRPEARGFGAPLREEARGFGGRRGAYRPEIERMGQPFPGPGREAGRRPGGPGGPWAPGGRGPAPWPGTGAPAPWTAGWRAGPGPAGRGYAPARPRIPDRPEGLGGFPDDPYTRLMHRGVHPGHPGADTVEPIRAGGWGGAVSAGHLAGAGGEGFGRERSFAWRGSGAAVERGERLGAARADGERGFGWQRGRPAFAERMGPGAWKRTGRAPAPAARREVPPSRAEATRGRNLGGRFEEGDWYGSASPRPREESSWYGGGVHFTPPSGPPSDFGDLGGPRGGTFGREEIPGAEEGRGFGGPLGSWRERARGEQGPLGAGEYRGREYEIPYAGRSYGGRGHIGAEDHRDLLDYGEGGAGRGSRQRFRERSEEGEHFPPE